MMPEKLKPCPFCGSTNVEISPYGGAKAIACMDCFCRSEIFGGEDAKEKAIAAWNRRVQQPNEPLTVDELRKMIGQWVWVESKDVLCPNGWYRVEPQFRETISLAGVDGTIYETSITNGDSVSYRRPLEAGEKG